MTTRGGEGGREGGGGSYLYFLSNSLLSTCSVGMKYNILNAVNNFLTLQTGTDDNS